MTKTAFFIGTDGKNYSAVIQDGTCVVPWEAPTGAHDMYKAGEYMIWTDNKVYLCKQDTNFSPAEYPQAWEKV